MRPGLEGFVYACALLFASCKTTDANPKGAPNQAQSDRASKACSANSELCNGRDDDCDGVIDEEVAADCHFEHAESRCVSGQCMLTGCLAGYFDCDDSNANGCESAEQDIACGTCGHACDMPDATPVLVLVDAQVAPDASELATPPTTPQQSMDASLLDSDADTVIACVAQTERCDGVDNDCDGAVDEGGVCDACISLNPSGQTADCDRCACARCSAKTARCTGGDSTWSMRCVALLQCYGKSNLAGLCPSGDCFETGHGPCSSQAMAAALGDSSPTCAQEPVTTPCGAAAVVREQCLLTTCAGICKF